MNKAKDTKTHLLSGLVQCLVCGGGMYGNKSVKHRKDGSKYKDFTIVAAITGLCPAAINAIIKSRPNCAVYVAECMDGKIGIPVEWIQKAG